MPNPVTVTTVQQTCPSCPSQWEGTTSDGRSLYVRYRWGTLQIGLGETRDAAIDAALRTGVVLGDPLDGRLTYGQLVEVTVGQFDWPT